MTLFQNKLQTFLVSILIFFSPLLMHQHSFLTAEIGMQVIGVLMLFILFFSSGYKGAIGSLHWLFIVVSISAVAIYLVPIPEDLWSTLQGRDAYRESATFVADQLNYNYNYYSLSVIPDNSKGAFFYVIPLVAVFLVVMSLPIKSVNTLITVLLVIASLEATLGIIQYSTGSEQFYMNQEQGKFASGTYTNRDHFIVIFEFALPVIIGALVSTIERKSITDSSISKIIYLLVLMIVFLVASMMTASRAGIGSIVIGFLMAFFIYSFRVGSIKSFGLLTLSGVFTVIVLFKIGIVPVLNRFAADPLEDGRWVIFENTKKMIHDFLPFGSGPGTFSEVYRAYQPIDQSKFINHAHNDYLELITDMGYFGVAIIVFFIFLFALRWLSVLSNLRNEKYTNLQIGAGIGMLLLLIHSYLDFNFHVPANALLFVFMAGIFFNKKTVTY